MAGKVKFLGNNKDLEEEIRRGNMAALREYVELNIEEFESKLRYSQGENNYRYQGALRVLDDILDLLP